MDISPTTTQPKHPPVRKKQMWDSSILSLTKSHKNKKTSSLSISRINKSVMILHWIQDLEEKRPIWPELIPPYIPTPHGA